MSVNTDDPRAPYVQVADELWSDIDAGRLKPGARMPSIRNLADRFGVSAMTIQNALRILRISGLITTQQGRGTYVHSDAKKVLKRLKDEALDTYDPDDAPTLRRQIKLLQSQVKELLDRMEALEGSAPALSSRATEPEG